MIRILARRRAFVPLTRRVPALRGRSPATTCLLVALASCGLWCGCERPVARRSNGVASLSQNVDAADDLAAAMKNLADWRRLDEPTTAADMLYHLNRWIGEQKVDATWKPDPLLERLPRTLKNLLAMDDLGRDAFQDADLIYLREAYWMHEVGRRVLRGPASAEIVARQKQAESTLGRDVAGDLARAERLFDWTIRNIQLDPLPPVPAEEAAGPVVASPGAPAGRSGERLPLPAAARGVVGPGYGHDPWQTLLLGHGDAWERARVFIALGRQQDLEVVMLAVEDPQSNSPPRPWLAALLLEQRLYLFDTSIGWPILDADGASVATLEQLQKQPALLDRLSVDEKLRYPLSAPQLEQVVALLDVRPELASRRMQTLEPQLPATHRLAIGDSPSALADRLRAVPAIRKVAPWSVPWETMLYWNALQHAARNSQRLAPELFELQMFAGTHPLALGRIRHLLDEGEASDGEQSAKSFYLRARLPDREIEALTSDEKLQAQIGLMRLPRDDDASWGRRIAATQEFCRHAKIRASYWLGLLHYEAGDYALAVDWLKDRSLDVAPEGFWAEGARYNLARAYEELGRTEDARRTYFASESPQKLGDWLRGRRQASRTE